MEQFTPLIPLIAVIPLLLFWIWMFRDLNANDHLLNYSRYTWTLLFIFMNVFGACLYYFMEYTDRH